MREGARRGMYSVYVPTHTMHVHVYTTQTYCILYYIHTLQLTRPMVKKEPPPYGHRKNWVPRSLQDYGDGGAFPEVHIAQYPLNMGKKKSTVS